MKIFILGMFLLTFGQTTLNAQSDVAFEKVSICLTNNLNRCLSRARVETISENDPLTVEVVLKAMMLAFLGTKCSIFMWKRHECRPIV